MLKCLITNIVAGIIASFFMTPIGGIGMFAILCYYDIDKAHTKMKDQQLQNLQNQINALKIK